MKQTELRLGNYITIHGCLQEIVELPLPENCTDENTKPIPLTEEWLLKFHSNALDLSNSIFRIGRFKLIWKFSYQYWYVIDDITGAYITKIEFVHEWQNFWHIMNGEELTLKQTESI